MNLWRAWSPGPNNTRRVIWATSERECRKLAKNEFGDNVADVKSLELPTNKPSLVEWLNANVNNIAV
jgi:hypothetical protein